FFSSRRRHTRLVSDWSSDVCSSDLYAFGKGKELLAAAGRIGEATGLSGSPDMPEAIGQFGQDLLTVGGTAAAPLASLVGTAAGAGARALGADQGTAELADLAGGLGTGIAQGIGAIRGVRSAVASRFGQVAENAAQRGDRLALGSPEA